MNAAARGAVLTAQAVLLVLAARWMGVHSGKDDMTDAVAVLLFAGLGLSVAAVVIVLRGDVDGER